MTSLNISLPDVLKSWVDEQVATGSYGTSSEYVQELIRRDRDLKKLRALLVEGLESDLSTVADDAYFSQLRERASRNAGV